MRGFRLIFQLRNRIGSQEEWDREKSLSVLNLRRGINILWSKYVQGTKTLYFSRKLRFDDLFSEQYKCLFDLDVNKERKILEIGCGPGALAGALHRWYPYAEITAVDPVIYWTRNDDYEEPMGYCGRA